MNLILFDIIQKNKIVFLIFLLIFTLLSVHMSNGLFQMHEHQEYASSFAKFINSNKLVAKLKKIISKVKVFLNKVFKFRQMLSNLANIANIQLALFFMLFSENSIFYLFSVLCSYIHGGKFKKRFTNSYLCQ